MTKRKISVVLICLILLSVLTVRRHFVEGKEIQRDNDNQSISLSEQEIAEEVNKKVKSAFVENQGQVANEEVIFYGSLTNGKIGFGKSKVMLWMEGMNDIVTLNFVGAQKVSPIGLDEQIMKSNYFLGDRGTYTNVRSFGAIVYYNLWKGIDLYYKVTPKGVKYEFWVASGVNPEVINISCEGHKQLIVRKDSVAIMKDDGQFVDDGLMVYQEGEEINARFITKGVNSFGFHINKYDQRKPLVIDPLIYSTYVGASREDIGYSIALDREGNAFVTGETSSSDFPTTENAYNNTSASYYNTNCFVLKLSVDGSSLLYSTYVGGISVDYGKSIAIDGIGNAFVTGYTKSSNFPTTVDAYDRTLGGLCDCFVFKLSANGSSLLYSTLVGGNNFDYGRSIVLDTEGNAFVTGNAKSSDFPTTTGAYDEWHNGDSDCFIFKLSVDGSSLINSTFVGGSDYDLGQSITIDNMGNAFVTGWTGSSNFPTTINAYDESYNGGYHDCFIIKLSANGSLIHYSTYIGGSDSEIGKSIVLDGMGNAFVTGWTESGGFPTTANAYNRIHKGETDCFVSKLSANGSFLHYSTFVGGSDHDDGFSIALDSEGIAYVTGITFSSDFPITNNDVMNVTCECFIFKLSAEDSTLLYSTFVGGSGYDWGYSIALDSDGNAYVTGKTGSDDFPTTENAYDRSFNDIGEVPFGDCFIFKISTVVTIGFGIPTKSAISLTIISLTMIATIVLIIPNRKKRK